MEQAEPPVRPTQVEEIGYFASHEPREWAVVRRLCLLGIFFGAAGMLPLAAWVSEGGLRSWRGVTRIYWWSSLAAAHWGLPLLLLCAAAACALRKDIGRRGMVVWSVLSVVGWAAEILLTVVTLMGSPGSADPPGIAASLYWTDWSVGVLARLVSWCGVPWAVWVFLRSAPAHAWTSTLPAGGSGAGGDALGVARVVRGVGVLGLVHGACVLASMVMQIIAAVQYPEAMPSGRMARWWWVLTVVGYLLAIAWAAGAVGALRGREWGRQVLVGWGWASLASFVVNVVARRVMYGGTGDGSLTDLATHVAWLVGWLGTTAATPALVLMLFRMPQVVERFDGLDPREH